MADPAAKSAEKAGSFLTHKIGPLPLGIWLAAGVGLYLYFQRQQRASAASGAATGAGTGTTAPGTGTDAGNGGLGGSGDGSAGQQGGTGKPTYTDNNAWGIAAVNFLAGLGIDAATANQAIQLYLSSQPLTTGQQGDVNLAIQQLGPPPTLPGPIATNPIPVTKPPVTPPPPSTGGGQQGGPVQAPPGTKPPPGVGGPPKTPPPKPKTVGAPTGLVVSGKSGHSLAVKWNRVTGATGYHVLCTDAATKAIKSEHDLSAATLTATFTGLQASHTYVVDVWGLPRASGSSAHAEVSATLPRTG